MSRQVDIKALVSHIVRGDGSDRCRICMGDTADGQVHLEDTVMMDGDKPVTLAELLEIITGVEVESDHVLPSGTCRACSEDIIAATNLRNLCARSSQHWNDATIYFSQMQEPAHEDKAYFVFYTDEQTIIKDQIDRVATVADALERLNMKYTEKPQKIRRPRKKRDKVLPCSCPNCGKDFSTPEYLNFHLKNTMNRACDQCGVVLPKKKLAEHYSDNHNLFVIECSICNAIFDKEISLNEHYIQNHKSAHSCTICGNGYSNLRGLRAHVYAHSLFYCKSCNQSFDNVKCYRYHQKLCKEVEQPVFMNFVCDHCGAEYDRKPSLRIHIVQKHLNVLPYICIECGKRTSTMAHLKSHEKVHKIERKIYQCYCGAKLRTELGYQLHLRIHTGERPYECEYCGDRFLSSSRRMDHIKRRHKGTNDMPHACEKCPARFVRPCELKKHYLSVHYTVVNVMPVKREVNPVTRRLRTTFEKHEQE